MASYGADQPLYTSAEFVALTVKVYFVAESRAADEPAEYSKTVPSTVKSSSAPPSFNILIVYPVIVSSPAPLRVGSVHVSLTVVAVISASPGGFRTG